MGLDSLPQELIDDIVDHLDNKELVSCSFTSRIFLSRCRQHLFRTLSIVASKTGHLVFMFNENQRGHYEIVAFLALLQRQPIFPSYIRHLRVDMVLDALFLLGHHLYNHDELAEILQLLCPSVQDFTLRLADQIQDELQQSVQASHGLFRQPSDILRNVTALDLESIHTLPFDLARCSKLVALTVRKCSFEIGGRLTISSGQQVLVLGNLKTLSASLGYGNADSNFRFAEAILQLSAKSIEHLRLVYPARPVIASRNDIDYILRLTESIKSSKNLSLVYLPSLCHLYFEITDELFYKEKNAFSPIAEILKTCTPNSKISSISLLTTLHIANSRLSKSTEELYEDWEWRNWEVLDQPLYDLGRTLQRPITLEVHAHVGARRSRTTLPKPDLGRDLDFKTLFRSKFPKACRSEFLSWKYDWTVYEC